MLKTTLIGPDESPSAVFGAWALALMAAALLTILLLRPVWDSDIFWQLKLGEIIMAHGGPITREPFSAGHLGEPLPAVAWLGQVVMAEVRALTGWTGLRIFDAVCWLGGFLVVATACRRRGASARGLIVALAIAFAIAYPTASIRPQTFAVLGFGAVVAMLRLNLPPWRMAAFATLLLPLWQNLHPSVGMAALAFGTYAAIDWARWLAKRGSPPWETSLLTLLALLSTFATPDGWSILRVSAENAAASTAMVVTEWLPLWHPANRASVPAFALVCAVLAGLVVIRPRRVEPRELALALACLALTALANRFVLFAAIALIPVVARALTRIGAAPVRPGLQTPLLLIATAIATPLQHPTHFAPNLALDAIDALRQQRVTGVIMTSAPWGGPLIDRGYPRWRVAYDGRLYRHSAAEWRLYNGIVRGDVPLTAIERRFQPAAFVIEPGWKSLVAQLRASPQWEPVWSDNQAVVFKRRR